MTTDAGGNSHTDVMLTCRACEQAGVRTTVIVAEMETRVPLLSVGEAVMQMEVPAEPGVRYLGFLSEQDKWGALAGAVTG